MPPPKLKLSLFVCSENSGTALARLYKALEFYAYTDFELSIVDVAEEPIRTQSLEIRETPTLILHTQSGDIRMTNDLSDFTFVRKTFGFKASE
ncbi:MAG: hypothetical protein DKT66_11480 [Candidatus Melainabacteria bacterium]|nr:MAG: hypothetical protein DKT66_11480 [Candidatus Melainabacteria bacterium]